MSEQEEISAAAAALGKRGRGRPKKITQEERQRRSEQMKQINAKRRVVMRGRVVSVPQDVKPPLVARPSAGEVRRFG